MEATVIVRRFLLHQLKTFWTGFTTLCTHPAAVTKATIRLQVIKLLPILTPHPVIPTLLPPILIPLPATRLQAMLIPLQLILTRLPATILLPAIHLLILLQIILTRLPAIRTRLPVTQLINVITAIITVCTVC